MNNIHEKDWSDDSWSGHSGMENDPEYCFQDEKHQEERKLPEEQTSQPPDQC